MQEKIEEKVKSDIQKYEDQKMALESLESELESSPQFAKFIEAQKQFREIESNVWSNIEQLMLDNDIKSIKTDKITLTIAERVSFDIDLDLLPNKFIKRVPDTTKINGTYKLEGKPVKGTTPRTTRYLMKRVK